MSLGTLVGLGTIGSLIGSAFGRGNQSTTQTTMGGGTENVDATTQAKGSQASQYSEQQLNDILLKQLEDLFSAGLDHGGFMAGQEAMTGRLDQVRQMAQRPEFDAEGFAQGITDQAASRVGMDLEGNINNLLSSTGSSEGGNSMASLLANRMRTDAADSLAGTAAAARATGEQIRQAEQGQITDSIAGLSGGIADQILGLIQQTSGQQTAGTRVVDEEQEQIQQIRTKTSPQTQTATTTERKNPWEAIGNIFSVLGGSSSAA